MTADGEQGFPIRASNRASCRDNGVVDQWQQPGRPRRFQSTEIVGPDEDMRKLGIQPNIGGRQTTNL
jgi:hypothetical protein